MVKVKNDVKLHENAIEVAMIKNPDLMFDWEPISPSELEGMRDNETLYDRNGPVSQDEEFNDEYFKVEEGFVKTKLDGDFIVGKGGKVYYDGEKINIKDNGNQNGNENGSGNEGTETVTIKHPDGSIEVVQIPKGQEPQAPASPNEDGLYFDGWEKTTDSEGNTIYTPKYKYLATDSDFQWVTNPNGYEATGQTGKGHFKYVGIGKEIVEIPHVIQGNEMTSYFGMFSGKGEDVKKVISTNDKVTDMTYMFYDSQAKTLDLSSFDTSKVTDMSYMFWNSQATSLDLSNWNTSNVTNMSYMFYNSPAKTLDLSSFDTSNVTNMTTMFYGSQVDTLDLSTFDTSSVTNMNHMFSSSKATTLDLSSFDTSNVTNMSYMFYNSPAESLDLSSFDTSKVTDMSGMFYFSQATSLDLSSFDTSNVTNMRDMFRSSKATTLDLSSFNTSKVDNMYAMFYDSQAKSLDLSNWDTSNVTDMSYMFASSQATEGYAKTQADADKFNASSGRPAVLTFYPKQ